MRNHFRPRPEDGDAREDGSLKDRIKTHSMSMDFFHAVAPWYQVLANYTTNIMRSPHVEEDTALCLTTENADGEEVEMGAGSVADPVRTFVLNHFAPGTVDDALKEADVKKTMKMCWPHLKLKDVVTKMTANGFVMKDVFIARSKRYLCYRFEAGQPARPVGPKPAAAPSAGASSSSAA